MSFIRDIDERDLLEIAKQAMQNAYAPYSSFQVGAALLTKSGKIYTGCNVENAAFSPTICAERGAFAKAISEGEREFLAIAIVGGKNGKIEKAITPCGVCRQVMGEFCTPDFKIILADGQENIQQHTLKELLPLSFGAGDVT